MKYKNLEYQTTSYSLFDNIPKETIFNLFNEQEAIAKKELTLFETYNYISK
jgi:hypothetical protein